jgi:hypothetical protein
MCPTCIQDEEKSFQKVKDFLRENQATTVQQISEGTEVSVDTITKFYREGRLQSMGSSVVTYGCYICGKSITTGKVCSTCESSVSSLVKPLPKNDPAKTKGLSFFTKL